MKFYFKLACAIITGGLLAFAFAPAALYPLAVFSPAVLLLLWLNASARQAFLLGLLFGIGFYGMGVSWVFISIHDFAQTNLLLSLLITGLFIALLSLFTALQGYCLNYFFPNNTTAKCYLVFPSSWALIEWLRSWLFTGFPWLLLGTSQIHSPLSGYIPLLGPLGLSFLVSLSSSLLLVPLYSLLYRPLRFQIKINPLSCLCPLFLFTLLWALGYALCFIHWTYNQGNPIQISLIQPNITQEVKWDAEHIQKLLPYYQKLSQPHWDSRLVVWPEAAVPLLQKITGPLVQELNQEAKRHHVTLITGLPLQEGFRYYNAMLALGLDRALYYKQRLVIFGEYIPWWVMWARGLFNLLDIPMSSFSSGTDHQPPFKVANLTLGTFICYEIAYFNLVREELLKGAQLLLTINDDGWFGHSFALAQHLQIGQFQALATGRYLAFLSNTGITAFITPRGHIEAKLPIYQKGVLTRRVYKTEGLTPWVRLGDKPILVFLVGLCVLCYASLRHNNFKKTKED